MASAAASALSSSGGSSGGTARPSSRERNSSSFSQALRAVAMKSASSRLPWARRSSDSRRWRSSSPIWVWASAFAWASMPSRFCSASFTMESAIFWAVRRVARMESSVAR